MLSLCLKRCTLYTQIRKFATFHTRGEASVKRRLLNYRVEPKNWNVTGPNLIVQRLLSTDPSKERTVCIEPLMCLPDASPYILYLSTFIGYWHVRLFIDQDFKLREFVRGAKQAITLTVDALAKQNYEALEGLVKEKSLKVLKHRVGRLTPDQRRALGSTQTGVISFPGNIVIRQCRDPNEILVEVKLIGCLYGESSPDSVLPWSVLCFCYTFQRKYINKIGNSWIIKIANLFSLDGIRNRM